MKKIELDHKVTRGICSMSLQGSISMTPPHPDDDYVVWSYKWKLRFTCTLTLNEDDSFQLQITPPPVHNLEGVIQWLANMEFDKLLGRFTTLHSLEEEDWEAIMTVQRDLYNWTIDADSQARSAAA